MHQKESSQAYLYDLHNFIGSPQFLGGMQIDDHEGDEAALTQLPEVELDELLAMSGRHLSKEITIANKRLVAVVVASPGTFQADVLFVILGGGMILVASVALAAWVWSTTRRVARETIERTRSEAEKTALILDNAQQAATAERELVCSNRLLICGLIVCLVPCFLDHDPSHSLQSFTVNDLHTSERLFGARSSEPGERRPGRLQLCESGRQQRKPTSNRGIDSDDA
jgi:hypothetical protein